MLDEPRPVYYGGLTAGPTFAEIMEFSLNHRRVPPSNPAARSTAEPAQAAPVDPVDVAAGSTEGDDLLFGEQPGRSAPQRVSRTRADPTIPAWATTPAEP
jgi:hypothetical protein